MSAGTDGPHASSDSSSLSSEVNAYLTMAESIATPAYLCAAGDDYRPGYFSEISLDANGITLEQINHMNSRSLNHKTDYSLRNLEFFIPLDDSPEQNKRPGIDTEYIGKMRVDFSDRSSENNRKCGDKIMEKLEEERAKFSMRGK
jgi:hypothetical protein